MNKFAVFAVVLLLAGCATSQQEAMQQCPQIGVNVTDPDFTQKKSPEDINAFYECMVNKVVPPSAFQQMVAMQSPSARFVFGSNNAIDQQSLKLQWLLWKQIAAKEKSPTSAEEAWLIWQRNGAAITASEDAAAAANGAANATNQAAQQANMNAMRPVNCTNMGGMINCQ